MKIRNLMVLLLMLAFFSVIYAKPHTYKCQDKLQKALTQINKKRYNSAKSILEDAKINCNGSSFADSIIYYLAKCDIKLKLYNEAKLELMSLRDDYPGSPFVEEAVFLSAYATYMESPDYERDQTKTNVAVRLLRDYIASYPSGKFVNEAREYIAKCFDRLAKKEFMAGKFYQKINKYESAVIYFKSLIETYPDSKYVPLAKLNLIKSLLKVDRVSEAKAVNDEMQRYNYDPKIKEDAQNMIERESDKASK